MQCKLYSIDGVNSAHRTAGQYLQMETFRQANITSKIKYYKRLGPIKTNLTNLATKRLYLDNLNIYLDTKMFLFLEIL